MLIANEGHGPPPEPTKGPVKIILVRKAQRVEKPKKRHDFSGHHSIATIHVRRGEASQTFNIHKSYLVVFSGYFEAAFNGPYLESETSTVTLEDVSPEMFGIFANWVYHQKIEDATGERLSLPYLVELWLFAQYVQAPHLQNEIIESMDKQASKIHLEPRIDFDALYDSTDPSCPLRLYVASLVSISHFRGSKDLDDPRLYPHQLLMDILNWGNKFKREKNGKVIKPILEKFMVDEVKHDSTLRKITSLPAKPGTLTQQLGPAK